MSGIEMARSPFGFAFGPDPVIRLDLLSGIPSLSIKGEVSLARYSMPSVIELARDVDLATLSVVYRFISRGGKASCLGEYKGSMTGSARGIDQLDLPISLVRKSVKTTPSLDRTVCARCSSPGYLSRSSRRLLPGYGHQSESSSPLQRSPARKKRGYRI